MTHSAITNTDQERQLLVGATADRFARSGVFADYQARRARNTLHRQRDDLATFADYLAAVQFYASPSDEAQRLYSDPTAWSGILYGLIAGFVRWLLQDTDAARLMIDDRPDVLSIERFISAGATIPQKSSSCAIVDWFYKSWPS